MDTKADTSIHSGSTGRSALTSRGDVFKSTASINKNAVGYMEPTSHVTHVTLRSKSSDGGEIVRNMDTKADTSIHSGSIGRSALTSRGDVFKSTASFIKYAVGYIEPTSHVTHVTLRSKS